MSDTSRHGKRTRGRHIAFWTAVIAYAVLLAATPAHAIPRLALESVAGAPGTTVAIPLLIMEAREPVAGFNATVHLPEGVVFQRAERGPLLPSPDFVLAAQALADPNVNAVTILAYTDSRPLTESGILCSLIVSIPDDLASGDYPLVLDAPDRSPPIRGSHALASADGSTSLDHAVIDGTLTIAAVGALRIVIEPEEVGLEGARWRRKAANIWRESDDVEFNIALGAHTVEFRPIPGWNAPDDLVVNVMEGDPVEDVGTYTRILYEVVVEAVGGGSAVLDKDGYVHGEEARATATPDEGHVFVNWTENGIVVSVDVEYAFTVTDDRNLRANFVEERPILFLVSLAAHPPQGGNVLFAPEGRQAGDYYAFFEPETAVTLTAQAESGWHFENWTEAGEVVEGAGAEYSFETPDAHRYLTATFAEVQPIPTLSEWGMIILAGLLLLFGAFRVHTRQRPDVS